METGTKWKTEAITGYVYPSITQEREGHNQASSAISHSSGKNILHTKMDAQNG